MKHGVVGLLLVALTFAATTYAVTKAQYRVTRLGETTALFSCMNGDAPQTHIVAQSLLLTCGPSK